MMNILLCLPRVNNDCEFYRGPTMADDEYPVEDIQYNEATNEPITSDSGEMAE